MDWYKVKRDGLLYSSYGFVNDHNSIYSVIITIICYHYAKTKKVDIKIVRATISMT